MKNLLFYFILSLAILACNENKETEDSSSKNTEDTSSTKNYDNAKALYESNLASLKAGISAFENDQIDGWSASVADSVVWNPAAYGASPAKKDDWKKTLSMYLANWDSLKLINPSYLPGVDSATKEFDGSVRYYGQWNGVHKSGVHTSVNYYATFEFNKDNKVISASEFFDVGGLMNAVKSK